MRLLVAATGGHLAELVILADRLRPRDDDVIWVTSHNPQSTSLLAGRRVIYAPEVAPRDWRALRRILRPANRLLGQGVTSVVSTGSGVALGFLPLATAHQIPAHYIECSARVDGFSLTGRLLGSLPAVHRYAQYPHLAGGDWSYAGSVFDGFRSQPAPRGTPMSSIVVTVGTVGYPFGRLLARLRQVLPSGVRLLVQAGPDAAHLNWPQAELHEAISATDLERAMRDADIVIAHAGVGSALSALNAGKVPILVPRRGSRGEHVDDHQTEIARHLSQRGLAVTAEADAIGTAELEAALRRRSVRRGAGDDFILR